MGKNNIKDTKALRHYGTKFTLAYLLQKICKDLKSHRKFQATRRNFGDLPSALVPYCPNALKKNAFTLAEVLITLAIIGVVSALVIPSVLKNYNDKKYNTARLKALKTFGEAGKMASINEEMNSQANATDFVNNVLSKYLKIVKVCDNSNPTDCGFPSEIQPSNPSSKKLPVDASHLVKWNQIGINTTSDKVSAPINNSEMSTIVSTNDGFSAKIFYNPACVRNSHDATTLDSCTSRECPINNIDAACMNVIYDMNGPKGPNHIGEDVGIVTTFWSGIKAISVAPGIIPYSVNTTGTLQATFVNAPSVCAQKSTSQVEYTMPSIDEISSLTLNSQLVSLPNTNIFSGSRGVSSEWFGSGAVWVIYSTVNRGHSHPLTERYIWCVRR